MGIMESGHKGLSSQLYLETCIHYCYQGRCSMASLCLVGSIVQRSIIATAVVLTALNISGDASLSAVSAFR